MTHSQLTILNKRIPASLIYLLIFVVAFIPRVLALDAYVAPDEGKWIYRSAHFLQALLAGDLARTTSVAATPEVEVLAPAVPTMWTGAAGLAAKYWLAGSAGFGSLSDYLAAIPRDTEKITLDLYPWSRFPTVLLTSLSLPLFFFLLSQLIGTGPALLAVLLLALDPFFISLSRVIHHDALVSIFIVGSLLMLLLYRERRKSRGWLILSGVGGGLALLTKPTALYLVIFAGLFLWLEKSAGRRAGWRQVVTEGMVWGLAALLTVVALWPALWVAPFETFTALTERSTSALDNENSYSLVPAPGTPLPELGLLYYPVNWLFKATLPILIGLVALGLAWWRGWLKTDVAGEGLAHQPNDSPPTSRSTLVWLTIFILLFLLLLIPANTRDIRYFLPAIPALYTLAAAGLLSLIFRVAPSFSRQDNSPPHASRFTFQALRQSIQPLSLGLLLAIQLALTLIYYPYYVDYWNPIVGGPWLAPNLVKVGSGEGLDQMGRYLSQKPESGELTVATSFWESFAPFFSGRYTKSHYDDEADYILIYRRQIQNRNPFPEYWTFFSARTPEHKVSLVGLDYAWLYPGPQLRVVRDADFGEGLSLRGYRLERWAAQPGQRERLTLVWSSAAPAHADKRVSVQLIDAGGRVVVEGSGPLLAAEGPSPVEGHYALAIPAELVRGDYELWVSVRPDEARVSEPPRVKAGRILVRQLDKPAVRFEAAANFGDLLTFGGADLGPTALLPGQPVELTLLWQARRPIEPSYTTFVHLVDEAGQIWGQADRIPSIGDRPLPTPLWDEEEWIVDQFQLSLKPDAPAGDYLLLTGVYDSQTLERLPVLDPKNDQTVLEITSLRVRSVSE